MRRYNLIKWKSLVNILERDTLVKDILVNKKLSCYIKQG